MAPERGARSLPPQPARGTDGLPRAFLQSLRTLFDILDDRRRGYVHLREIESRWRGAEARELPPGVLEGLRQAAPASGYLTFERFVLGLRASLLSPANAGKAARPAPGGGGPGRGPEEKSSRTGCVPPLKRAHPSSTAGTDGKPAGQPHGEGNSTGVADVRRHERGRREHRRHTITNGVDYGMLKQMKELEQEKDFLLQGLEMVERAREWYHQQIQTVQERQKHLGKNRTTKAFFPEETLLPKLQEVNRCLGELLSIPAKTQNSYGPVGLPDPSAERWGREVTDKSERITQLEQEKSALIKQLFEARARNNTETSQLDSTFL
uniref:Suppressor APC domain containing 2 n=1 Tax=Pelusios castaneus TaxID=367368 RepID=A0A8C8REH7_9SAUR